MTRQFFKHLPAYRPTTLPTAKVPLMMLLLTGFCLSACMSGPIDDPYSGYNHFVFEGNKRTDRLLIEPAARAYRAGVPDPARDGVSNFLDNLEAPTDVANHLLQGKPEGAAHMLTRFAVNSIAGLGGLFDPASKWGLEARKEDFGQTLGVWGMRKSNYFVLPFFGPSSVRDTIGLTVDIVSHPVSFARYTNSNYVRLSRFGMNGLDARTNALDLVQSLRENSLDEYAAQKSLYEQSRADAIRDGALDLDDLPDFDEYDDEE